MILRCHVEILKQVVQESKTFKARKEVVLFFQQKPSLHLICKDIIRSWSLEVEHQGEALAAGVKIEFGLIQKVLNDCLLHNRQEVHVSVTNKSQLIWSCWPRKFTITESSYLNHTYHGIAKAGVASFSEVRQVFDAVFTAVESKPVFFTVESQKIHINGNHLKAFFIGGVVGLSDSGVPFNFFLQGNFSEALRNFLKNEEGQQLRISSPKGFISVFENTQNGNHLIVNHEVCEPRTTSIPEKRDSYLLFCSHKKARDTFFSVLVNHLPRVKFKRRENLGLVAFRLSPFSQKEPSFVGRLEMFYKSIQLDSSRSFFPVRTDKRAMSSNHLGYKVIMNDLVMLFSLLNPEEEIRLIFGYQSLTVFQEKLLFSISVAPFTIQ